MRNVLPSFGLLVQVMVPPCASVSDLTMDSPNPDPPWSRLRLGVDPIETVKHLAHRFGRDTWAGVAHGDVDPLLNHADADPDRRGLRCVHQRIGQQIGQDLA